MKTPNTQKFSDHIKEQVGGDAPVSNTAGDIATSGLENKNMETRKKVSKRGLPSK